MTRYPGISGVILAGGRATRMRGTDKALLPAGSPGETILTRTLDLFSGRFAGCVIAGRSVLPAAAAVRGDLTVIAVPDRVPGWGPLGGLDAALRAVATPAVFACGCDMPWLSGPLVDFMAGRSAPGRALVPIHSGRPEPLHAIYPVACLPEIERSLAAGVRMMLDFLDRVPVDWLPEEDYAGIEGAGLSFTNINTPEDLERARR